MVSTVRTILLEELDEYQGVVHIEIQGQRFCAAYNLVKDIARSILRPNAVLNGDIWLLFGTVEPSPTDCPGIHLETNTCAGFYRGRIIEVHNSHSYRMECGAITFDIHNDRDCDFQCGDWVQVRAEMQIFPIHQSNICTKEMLIGP